MGIRKRLRLVAIACSGSAILGLLALPSSQSTAATNSFACPTRPFTADILAGPDADLSLAGRLGLIVNDAGRVAGTLRKADGNQLRVTGDVRSRTLSLVFQLPGRRQVDGHGATAQPITSCRRLPTEGSFSGPRVGDRGRWGYAIGG